MEGNLNHKNRKNGRAKQEPESPPRDPGKDLTPEQHEAQKDELERISARAQGGSGD